MYFGYIRNPCNWDFEFVFTILTVWVIFSFNRAVEMAYKRCESLVGKNRSYMFSKFFLKKIFKCVVKIYRTTSGTCPNATLLDSERILCQNFVSNEILKLACHLERKGILLSLHLHHKSKIDPLFEDQLLCIKSHK